jgi:hypothetical protein
MLGCAYLGTTGGYGDKGQTASKITLCPLKKPAILRARATSERSIPRNTFHVAHISSISHETALKTRKKEPSRGVW